MYSSFQVKPYYKNFQENIQFFISRTKEDFPTYYVHITELIEPHDPSAKKFEGPIQKEIERLLKMNTWKMICRNEALKDGNILNARFVLSIKDEGTDR